MKATSTCDSCGRIQGARVSLAGWFYYVPDCINDPWLLACSPSCAEKVIEKQNQRKEATQ